MALKSHRPGSNHKSHSQERRRKVRELRSSHQFRKITAQIKEEYPLCQAPFHDGPPSLAESIHHIIRATDNLGLFHHFGNLVPICNTCHDYLNALEAQQKPTFHLFTEWMKEQCQDYGLNPLW